MKSFVTFSDPITICGIQRYDPSCLRSLVICVFCFPDETVYGFINFISLLKEPTFGLSFLISLLCFLFHWFCFELSSVLLCKGPCFYLGRLFSATLLSSLSL